MKPLAVICFSVVFVFTIHAGAQEMPSSVRCQGLAGQKLVNAVVAKSEWIPSASVNAPGPRASVSLQLPEHCAVEMVSTPTVESLIHITVWLPAPDVWNHKMLATGNGGYSSVLSYRDMADGLHNGYAVGGSDTGHTGEDLSFGTQNPEKIRDWAYRATHELAAAEGELTHRFYGQKPEHAYFRGCSTGGQQALSEAQRYPEDFDGILAGDPGNDRILLNADFMMSWLATHPKNAPAFSHVKLDLLANAVMKVCDKLDGVVDGIISDPQDCTFDPAILLCKAGQDASTCLSSQEVETVHTLYAGPVRNGNSQPMYFGWERGSEAGWGTYLIDPKAPVRSEFWKDWVYNDSAFDLRFFDPQQAVTEARRKLPYTEAVNTDLSSFFKHGGKLLIYHGWADPVVPPQDSIAYFDGVRSHRQDKGIALFMVPGMSHCGGGPGASDFNALQSLDQWVISGAQPATIPARKLEDGKVILERPICAYPAAAVWDGKNDSTKASSFFCKDPHKEAIGANDAVR